MNRESFLIFSVSFINPEIKRNKETSFQNKMNEEKKFPLLNQVLLLPNFQTFQNSLPLLPYLSINLRGRVWKYCLLLVKILGDALNQSSPG